MFLTASGLGALKLGDKLDAPDPPGVMLPDAPVGMRWERGWEVFPAENDSPAIYEWTLVSVARKPSALRWALIGLVALTAPLVLWKVMSGK